MFLCTMELPFPYIQKSQETLFEAWQPIRIIETKKDVIRKLT